MATLAKPDPRPLAPQDWQWPEGRLRRELARKKRCCDNCTYVSRPAGKWLQLALWQYAGLLLCANSAEAPGQLRGVPGYSVCPNFRARRRPTEWGAPPAPPNDKVRYLRLTQGQYALVDAENYEWLQHFKWCANRSRKRFYAHCKIGRATIAMHRLLMNTPEGKVTDHKDGNSLNNCRCSLRNCTAEQNARNRCKKCTNSCEYKGVWQNKKTGKFHAGICFQRKPIHLGVFDTAVEAARAYDRKALELFHEFARLNFPREDYLGGQTTEDGGQTAEGR